MWKCFICNKYIYIYIYIYICLIHFVVNEDEYKYYLRFDGEPKKKWEFELDLNTEGGLNLSNQLKNKKEIALTLTIDPSFIYYGNLPLLNEESSVGTVPKLAGSILATNYRAFIIIHTTDNIYQITKSQKIGELSNLEGMSENNLKELGNGNTINLVLAYERIKEPDTPKIAEINKKKKPILFIYYLYLLFY